MTLPRSTIRRRRRGASVVRWLVRLAVVAVVFALGVAVGQALEDRPPASRPVTSVTTIQPWTQTVPPPSTTTAP